MDEDKTSKPIAAYKAAIDAYGFQGDGTVSIYENGIAWDGLFDGGALSFADVERISPEGSGAAVVSREGRATFSRMGREGEWFCRELREAYSARVKAAFQIAASPESSFKGSVSGSEGYCCENAAIELFEDGICILPGDKNARCLPFIFICGMQREGYSLTLTMKTGESYAFSMLGTDFEPLCVQTERRIRAVREKSGGFISKLCGELSLAKSSAWSRSVCEGAAAELDAIPAELGAVLMKKLQNSAVKEYAAHFAQLGDMARLAVGIEETPAELFEKLKEELLSSLQTGEEPPQELTAEQEDALRWRVWCVLPAAGERAIVEFSLPGEAAATYIFKTGGDCGSFLNRLNAALWLTKLERSAFSLAQSELDRPENEDIRMLLDRSPAVASLRCGYIGKVIHSGVGPWKSGVKRLISEAEPNKANTERRFCTQCGARLGPGLRFCTQCGKAL